MSAPGEISGTYNSNSIDHQQIAFQISAFDYMIKKNITHNKQGHTLRLLLYIAHSVDKTKDEDLSAELDLHYLLQYWL